MFFKQTNSAGLYGKVEKIAIHTNISVKYYLWHFQDTSFMEGVDQLMISN